MASILALPGKTNLVTMKNCEIVLTFGEQRYRRDEVIPSTLLIAMAGPGLPCTAGRYVEHCLIQQFGADRTGWPPLAQEFLSGGGTAHAKLVE